MTKLTREQAIAKWVKALRSGRYTQTTGRLQRVSGKLKTNCCLGVAERVIPGARFRHEDKFFVRGDCHARSTLTAPLAEFLQIGKAGRLSIKDRGGWPMDLIDLNDLFGLTFDQIADIIEAGLLEERT